MSRFTSIPVLELSLNTVSNELSAHSRNTVCLNATIDGSSAGFMCLDDLDDLFILRSEIDCFIYEHDLIHPSEMKKNLEKDNAESVCPDYTVLEGYLKGWAHADSIGNGTIVKTSQEIVADLEDMIDIDTTVVAHVLSVLGFKTHFSHDGSLHGWMMREDPEAVHTLRISLPEYED